MLQPPFLSQLLEAKSVLIAGAGGGFDVFCGLPLFFALKSAGVSVHLASLSFSFSQGEISGERIGHNIVEVTARSRGNEYYFPEGYLSQWFCRKRMDQSVYCIKPTGPKTLFEEYECLRKRLDFDAVVLVDGGVDSILKGDESKIGTPVEDMCSLLAVKKLDVPHKQIVCLGYGAETDVCSVHALETIAGLVRAKAFLGAIALTSEMVEVSQFVEATKFVFGEMRGYESVICSSVLAALDGHFGDHHSTRRTVGRKLSISPLMLLYWSFDLAKVASSILYLEQIENAESLEEVSRTIVQFRKTQSTRSSSDRPPSTSFH